MEIKATVIPNYNNITIGQTRNQIYRDIIDMIARMEFNSGGKDIYRFEFDSSQGSFVEGQAQYPYIFETFANITDIHFKKLIMEAFQHIQNNPQYLTDLIV
jgi:hypothetical protein